MCQCLARTKSDENEMDVLFSARLFLLGSWEKREPGGIFVDLRCPVHSSYLIIIDWILSIDGGGPIDLACKDNGNDIILRANDE